MINLNSNNIHVFPLSKPRLNDYGKSRLLYEHNIANIVRQLTDVDGFLINCPDEFKVEKSLTGTWSVKDQFNNDVEEISFNLGGYYVVVDNVGLKQIFSNTYSKGTSIYAHLNTTEVVDGSFIYEINGQDDDSNRVYTGIKFTTTIESTEVGKNYKLRLFDVLDMTQAADNTISGTVKPCKNSFNKFNTKSLDLSGITGIDGKHS